MEPVTVIVTALAAGAAAALQDGVKDIVKDGYQRLRDAVRNRLADRPDGELALERHETAPGKWEGVLWAELVDAGAGDDTSLVEAARALLNLIDGADARSGEDSVTIHSGQGFQVGDHNTQMNTFTNF